MAASLGFPLVELKAFSHMLGKSGADTPLIDGGRRGNGRRREWCIILEIPLVEHENEGSQNQ